MGEILTIGDQRVIMGAAGEKTKAALPPAMPSTEPTSPATFFKLADMGAMQNEMGWWGYLRNLFSQSSASSKP